MGKRSEPTLEELDPDLARLLKHVGRRYTFIRDSDRSTVVLGAAWLDDLLRQLLEACLLPPSSSKNDILESDGPLSSFSARTEVAYRLGLIDREFVRALNLIRKIRNAFAHRPDVDALNAPPFSDQVRELVKPFAKFDQYAKFEARRELYKRHSGAEVDFRLVVSILAMRLEGIVRRAKRIAAEPQSPIPAKWRVRTDA